MVQRHCTLTLHLKMRCKEKPCEHSYNALGICSWQSAHRNRTAQCYAQWRHLNIQQLSRIGLRLSLKSCQDIACFGITQQWLQMSFERRYSQYIDRSWLWLLQWQIRYCTCWAAHNESHSKTKTTTYVQEESGLLTMLGKQIGSILSRKLQWLSKNVAWQQSVN